MRRGPAERKVTMRGQNEVLLISLFVALVTPYAVVAEAPRAEATIVASNDDADYSLDDLGPLSPHAGSGSPTSPPSSAGNMTSTAATPSPELPTWAMRLLCLLGLGLAGLKKGRRNRLSPGIE